MSLLPPCMVPFPASTPRVIWASHRTTAPDTTILLPEADTPGLNTQDSTREWPINPRKMLVWPLPPIAARAWVESRSTYTGRVRSETRARAASATKIPAGCSHTRRRCALVPGSHKSGSARERYRPTASAAHGILYGRSGTATDRHPACSAHSLLSHGAAIVVHQFAYRWGRSSVGWAFLQICAQNRPKLRPRQEKQRTIFLGTIDLEAYDG